MSLAELVGDMGLESLLSYLLGTYRWRHLLGGGKTGQGPQRERGTAVGLESHQVLSEPKQSVEVTGSLGLTPEILM